MYEFDPNSYNFVRIRPKFTQFSFRMACFKKTVHKGYTLHRLSILPNDGEVESKRAMHGWRQRRDYQREELFSPRSV